MRSRTTSSVVAALVLAGTVGAGALTLAAVSGGGSGAARPSATPTPLPPLPVPTVLSVQAPPAGPTPPPQIVITPLPGVAPAAPASTEVLTAVIQRMMNTPAPNVTVLPGQGPSAEDRATMEAAQRGSVTGSPAPEVTGMPGGDAFFLLPKWHVQPLKTPIVWRKYVDPNIGFAFDYPAEWRLEGASQVEGFDFRAGGMLGVSILNYDPAAIRVVPLGKTAEFVKIDVTVAFVGSQLRPGETVQEYIGRALRSPTSRLVRSETIELGGVAGVLETIEDKGEGQSAPARGTVACAIKSDMLYCVSLIQLYPSASNAEYVEVLKQLAARFQTVQGK